jgi:hypothetical protein
VWALDDLPDVFCAAAADRGGMPHAWAHAE